MDIEQILRQISSTYFDGRSTCPPARLALAGVDRRHVVDQPPPAGLGQLNP
jgi:hypothetical protein